MDAAGARVWAPRFALAWTAAEAVTTWPVRRTEGGDFRADADCTVDCAKNPQRGSNLRGRAGVSRCECAESLASRGVRSLWTRGRSHPTKV